MKNLIFIMFAFLAFGVQADSDNAQFSGTIASFCTVGQTSPGIMTVSGTSVSTDTAAIMAVSNNDANSYKINATNAGDFTSTPSAYTGTASLTTSITVAGANTGSVPSGQELNLTNSGNDTVNVSISGTLDSPAVAGSYDAVAVVSCVAQ
ncbi:hypothetical protein NVP1205O_45 [Vibrio phage 1.205.O._10N.222.51.A7]|nr:hypothetical protein NVP1205O_45 [Vibrio phage 1.205.O._10N.222.51.A7]